MLYKYLVISSIGANIIKISHAYPTKANIALGHLEQQFLHLLIQLAFAGSYIMQTTLQKPQRGVKNILYILGVQKSRHFR